KPSGMSLSLKAPGICTGWKFESKTSMFPVWKLVAKRKAPASLKPIASPLYTAPDAELCTAMTAWFASTLLFQPAIVPSSVAKSSVAGPELAPEEITKPVVALVATPVGAEVPVPAGVGIVTAACTDWPVASYGVASPAPFSATHSPLLVPSVMPHGFTRLASVCAAGALPRLAKTAGSSVTRFVCVNVTAGTSRLSSSSTLGRSGLGHGADLLREGRWEARNVPNMMYLLCRYVRIVLKWAGRRAITRRDRPSSFYFQRK